MMIYVSNRPMGRNIRYLRRRKRLSLKALADRTQIPRWTMFLLETGILRDIDYEDLMRICDTLGVTDYQLIARKIKL